MEQDLSSLISEARKKKHMTQKDLADAMAVSFPDGMTTIGEKAPSSCPNLTRVYVPDSVTDIAGNALENSPNAYLVCSEGSYAQRWAVRNGIRWVAP